MIRFAAAASLCTLSLIGWPPSRAFAQQSRARLAEAYGGTVEIGDSADQLAGRVHPLDATKTRKSGCVETGTISNEGSYHILNNCVMRFKFPTSASLDGVKYTVDNVTVVLSKDNKVDLDHDAVLFEKEPSAGEKMLQYLGSSRIAGDGEFIIAQVTIKDAGTTLLYSFQVRPAPFYWEKLSLGAALSYNKPKGAADYQITPSPVLYSALGWGYSKLLANYLLPRSLGVMINPDAIASGSKGDLKPQLVVGIGASLLDDNIVVGPAWEGGNHWRPRFVVSWNALVFGGQ